MSERDSKSATPSDLDNAEALIRRALGVPDSTARPPLHQRPEQARQRHRFVQDGEVPVVILNSRKFVDASPVGGNRAQPAKAVLDAQQAERADAERSARETQAIIQSLQTKLAHAELAHDEALAGERRAREQAEKALREAVIARTEAEQRLREVVSSARRAEVPAKAVTATGTARGRPGGKAPAGPKVSQPQPVKWWLPSYRAKTKKP